MDMLKTGWNFFQNEVLGMAWLNRLIGNLINACGLDATSKIGGSIQFFVYDTIKIMVLLGVLILIISYIQSYFPPERTKKILGRFHGIGANIISALLGISASWVSSQFGKLLEDLDMPHIRFHDLRHTAATNMHQLTGDFYTVGEVLGHTLAGIGVSLGLSMNFEAVTARYVDVRLERKKEVLDAYHGAVKQADPAKAEKAEPKKAKSAAKKKSSDLEL